MNPRVGSALQHTRVAREEQAGEVVQNHEVGTWLGSGFPSPKEGSGRFADARPPGVDSPVSETTEGIFGQPQERMFIQRGNACDEPQDLIASGKPA